MFEKEMNRGGPEIIDRIGKPENLEKNLSEQGGEPTTSSTHI